MARHPMRSSGQARLLTDPASLLLLVQDGRRSPRLRSARSLAKWTAYGPRIHGIDQNVISWLRSWRPDATGPVIAKGSPRKRAGC